jgi:demethylmenaquinone methyltransferase / 2-methoxy-6-polyprenyl-1,4-benzoquinol methylase
MTASKAPELPHGDPRVVAAMFGRIAPSYDLLNRLLSLGLDQSWRHFATKQTGLRPGDKALDIACGTGDLAIELAKRTGVMGRVVGLDIAHEMIVLGKAKMRRRHQRTIDLHEGDAMALPYRDGVFRAVTMAFGGRNVPDLEGSFREMARVLSSSGKVVFLELNRPRAWGFRQVFDWYFHTFSPLVGGLISGDRAAYEYLPRSVDSFEAVEDIAVIMERAGLTRVEVHRLMFGVAVVHVGTAL